MQQFCSTDLHCYHCSVGCCYPYLHLRCFHVTAWSHQVFLYICLGCHCVEQHILLAVVHYEDFIHGDIAACEVVNQVALQRQQQQQHKQHSLLYFLWQRLDTTIMCNAQSPCMAQAAVTAEAFTAITVRCLDALFSLPVKPADEVYNKAVLL